MPGCAGSQVDLSGPVILGTAIADAQGVATLDWFVPGLVAGMSVGFQAVEQASCRVSDLELHTFP